MKKFLALGLAALLAIGATIVPDEFDKLFLRCNGTTTTFVDSSTANPKTITANGNATQIPVLEAGKPQAMFFNGTTDYVDIANSADFAFGVGAFEIEFSFMTNKAATAQTIIDNRNATADTDAWLVNIINSSGNKLCFTTATTARITGSTTLAINTKYRCKIVGNGGANGARTVIMYLAVGDGDYAQEGSTYTADYNFAKETLRIGSVKAAAGTYYNGWLKNLTLKKATTTVLDMRGDTPANSPLAPAIAFDGTGDYLSLADSADWDFGTGDYTVETFAQFNATGGIYYIISRNGDTDFSWLVNGSTFYHYRPSGYVNGTFPPTVGKWYHLALVHSGTSVRMYIDGKELALTSNSETDNFSSSNPITIGAKSDGNYGMNGSFREFRISNTARYTSAFTPSQTGFAVDANTKLYIKGDQNNGVGGNNSTDILDTTGKVVTCVNDTKIKYTEDYRSCIFKDETGKFPYPQGSAKVDFMAIGSGAGYFDGSTSYLTVPNSTDLKMGTGDYSIEGYGRLNVAQNYTYMFDMIVWPTGGWGLLVNASKVVSTVNGATDSNGAATTGSISLNTWFHLAQIRNSGVTKVYLNGTEVYSVADTYDFQQSRDLDIGAFFYTYNSTTYKGWAGLLDNIRISKGVARYTATFNPPDDYSAPRIGKRKTNWFFFF